MRRKPLCFDTKGYNPNKPTCSYLRSSNADVCSVAYTCYKRCYEKKRSTTRCWDGWRWFRCSSYRTTSHECGTTCHRRVCCDGWGGADCLTPLCQGLEECYNGGSCVDANVCVCLPGFEQPLCGDKNECETNNGDCDHICTNTVGSYTCSCTYGYLSANSGRTCTDIDECATANGGCSQHCQNLPGTFECSCQPGFYLDTDGKTCIDINECYTDNGNCQQKCDNMDGSYQCSCFEGYQMANGGTTCIDLDECIDGSHDCDHNCTNTVGSFTCGCAEGYDLDLDERPCTDVDECVMSESLCEQSCHNTDGSFFCSCSAGFDLLTDGRTCIDIIECEFDNGDCEYSCTNEIGSYTCGCQSGYRLADDRHSCHEVDECSEGISGCAQNCTNTIGSYTCGCTDGFVLDDDGNTCNDIDFCEGVSCDNEGTCSDGLATFTCVCAAGFTGDLCEQDVIECDVFNGGCQDTCTNTFGSYSCSCRENKTLAADGVSCTGTSPQDSVFRRHNIAGRTLPKGCWTIPVELDIDGTPLHMSLSSTSEWYSLDSDGNVRYTHGIVYATDGQLSVPISLEGLEVHQTPTYRTAAGVSNELKNKWGSHFFVPIFSGAYFDEWHALVTVRSLSTRFVFKFLGELVQIAIDVDDFVSTEVNAYLSYGGSLKRTVCGEMANPAGQFTAVMLRINPFLHVPLLQDWIFDAQLKVFLFVPTNQAQNQDRDQSLDNSNLVSTFQSSLRHFKIVLQEILNSVKEYASEAVQELITRAELSISQIVETCEEHLSNSPSGILSEDVNVINEIWQQLSGLQTTVDMFLDSIEGYIDTASDTVAASIRRETSTVINSFNSILLQVNNHMSAQLNDKAGTGVKFEASVSVFGLKLGWLNVELLVDFTEAFKCSRFDKLSQIYNGQETVKLLIQLGKDFPLGIFFKVFAGRGGAIVALKERKEYTVQLNTFVSILGVGATQDIFINKNGIFLYCELNVWNTFLAQVDVFAEFRNNLHDWSDLTLAVQGRFVAKSRERRQIQTRSDTFDSSLLAALISAVNRISDETKARLDGAKHALTSVQSTFSEAQQWLEGKKSEVRKANQYFDNAVDALEGVQRRLEIAKQPYNDAIGKLNEAQKDIDALCKVKRCNDICFPGISCKLCKLDLWIVKIPYPCCRTEGCMWHFPDPVCIAKNSMCYLAKGAAYVALEVAKKGVQAAMAPYDVAKLAVSAATFVVDKSRAVLTLAEGALSLAQIGFEGAKGALEAAKSALDVIKDVVGFAADIMEYVLQLGADNILDVRDCGFGIELSTKDLAVFDVTCKVKAFNLGWKTIRIRINFKNILQSIWQAAKATINAIIDGFGGIVRKRRDIGFHSAVSVHKLLRNIRSSENILNDTANATQNVIDTLKFTDGFKTDVQSDYENRVDLFEAKCDTIANVLSFLNETFQTLFYVANETQRGIDESLLTVSDLRTYNRSDIANNLTLENAGISIEHAMNDYNISEADLEQVLNRTKYQIFDDPILNEVDEMVELARNGIDSELSVAESVQILNQWLFAMENTTNTYFADTECLRFRDCVYHSMALLYELYTEEDGIPEIDTIRETIDALENVILDVLQNSSSSITEALNASSEIMSDIRYLTESNQFCSKPPVFTVMMQNVTAELGSSVVIVCDVVAEPEPVFWWFRNGSLVEEQRTATFAIHNVTHGDVATYRCTAGNIVANLSSDEVHLKVITFHYPVDTALETGYIILIAVLSSCCVVLAVVVLVFVRYKRRRATMTRMLNIELRHKALNIELHHNAFDNCGYAVGTAEKDRKPDNAEETVIY